MVKNDFVKQAVKFDLRNIRSKVKKHDETMPCIMSSISEIYSQIWIVLNWILRSWKNQKSQDRAFVLAHQSGTFDTLPFIIKQVWAQNARI